MTIDELLVRAMRAIRAGEMVTWGDDIAPIEPCIDLSPEDYRITDEQKLIGPPEESS